MRTKTWFSALSVSIVLVATFLLVPSPSMADTLRQGSTVLISVKPDGTPADGAEPSVSEDGRYVAFYSFDKLTADDTDSNADVYRKDMTTGQTILVSVEIETNRGSHNFRPSISGDGTKVAYLSGSCLDPQREPLCLGWYAHLRDVPAASTRVLSSTDDFARTVRLSRNGKWAAIVHERDFGHRLNVVNADTGARTFVTALCSGCGFDLVVSISGTGRFIAYETNYWRVPEDTDNRFDVYRYDRDADGNGVFDEPGNTALALVGILPDGTSFDSGSPDISDDGQRIAFIGASWVSTWGPIDFQTYVRDVASASSVLASQSSVGVTSTGTLYPTKGLAIGGPAGDLVSFSSYDQHLAPPDINPMMDVYVRDSSARTTTLASLLPDGSQDVGEKHDPSISYNGSFVAFGTTRLVYSYRLDRRVYLRNLETPCSVACPEDFVPSAHDALPAPPFDSATMCWDMGYVFSGMQTDAPTCHTDSGKVSASPATPERYGLLKVGGWDYYYGRGQGLPASFWLAGVYLSSASRTATVAAGTVSVKANISGEMFGDYERSLTVCLRIIQSQTVLSEDCIADDAAHSEPLRALSASATASAGTVSAEVILRTSKDFGYARINIDSLDITQ